MSDLIQLYATANIRIAELERENAALREQLEQAAIDEGKLRRENTRLLEAILNAPKAVCENAALRADKERLDWLETNGREQVYGPTWRIAWQFGQDVSLRAVIDAARKEAQS